MVVFLKLYRTLTCHIWKAHKSKIKLLPRPPTHPPQILIHPHRLLTTLPHQYSIHPTSCHIMHLSLFTPHTPCHFTHHTPCNCISHYMQYIHNHTHTTRSHYPLHQHYQLTSHYPPPHQYQHNYVILHLLSCLAILHHQTRSGCISVSGNYSMRVHEHLPTFKT